MVDHLKNTDNPELLWAEVNREQRSSDTATGDKYKNGNFFNGLRQLIGRL